MIPSERRGFVALRKGRVVKDRVDEVVDRTAMGEHSLADVDQFTRTFANNVHAQYLPRIDVEKSTLGGPTSHR